MIYVTGDTHGGTDFSKLRQQWLHKTLTSADYLIICGDVGFCWMPTKDQYPDFWADDPEYAQKLLNAENDRLEWLSLQKWTTLFVDGNHENFVRLYEYPVKDYCGGKAAQIAPKVWHLRRGEVYAIDGEKILTMGGATSIDKQRRTEGISWWPEEVPSEEEWANAETNLSKHKWRVDYVFTHCPPESIRKLVPVPFEERFCEKPQDIVTDGLEKINKRLIFRHWYFGHHHKDLQIDGKFCAVFEEIVASGGPITVKAQLTYQMTQAAKCGRLDRVEILIDRGADIKALPREIKGHICTQLMFRAAQYGSDDTYLRRIIRNGADLHKRDKDGNTALLLATINGEFTVAEFLLLSGSDASVTNNQGKDILSVLEKHRKKKEKELKLNPYLADFCMESINSFAKILLKSDRTVRGNSLGR